MALRRLVDDPEIDSDDYLIRVVQPTQFQGDDMMSNAFEDYSEDDAKEFGLAGPCASVNLRSIWLESSGNQDDLLRGFDPGSRLAQIRVGDLRDLVNAGGTPIPHGVMLDPRDGRPWHCVMFAADGSRRSRGGKRAVRLVAEWL